MKKIIDDKTNEKNDENISKLKYFIIMSVLFLFSITFHILAFSIYGLLIWFVSAIISYLISKMAIRKIDHISKWASFVISIIIFIISVLIREYYSSVYFALMYLCGTGLGIGISLITKNEKAEKKEKISTKLKIYRKKSAKKMGPH